MEERTIYHIAREEDLAAANISDEYQCESLPREGFIHCCLARQLRGVIDRYYAGVDGLQLLELDAQRLTAKVVYENTVGGDELFPHVYGKINMDAVVSISPLRNSETI